MGEAPWPFSCEVVAGRFSKRVEQAREGEALLEELDPQVAPVAPVALVVLLQVARDLHTEWDRVSY